MEVLAVVVVPLACALVTALAPLFEEAKKQSQQATKETEAIRKELRNIASFLILLGKLYPPPSGDVDSEWSSTGDDRQRLYQVCEKLLHRAHNWDELAKAARQAHSELQILLSRWEKQQLNPRANPMLHYATTVALVETTDQQFKEQLQTIWSTAAGSLDKCIPWTSFFTKIPDALKALSTAKSGRPDCSSFARAHAAIKLVVASKEAQGKIVARTETSGRADQCDFMEFQSLMQGTGSNNIVSPFMDAVLGTDKKRDQQLGQPRAIPVRTLLPPTPELTAVRLEAAAALKASARMVEIVSTPLASEVDMGCIASELWGPAHGAQLFSVELHGERSYFELVEECARGIFKGKAPELDEGDQSISQRLQNLCKGATMQLGSAIQAALGQAPLMSVQDMKDMARKFSRTIGLLTLIKAQLQRLPRTLVQVTVDNKGAIQHQTEIITLLNQVLLFTEAKLMICCTPATSMTPSLTERFRSGTCVLVSNTNSPSTPLSPAPSGTLAAASRTSSSTSVYANLTAEMHSGVLSVDSHTSSYNSGVLSHDVRDTTLQTQLSSGSTADLPRRTCVSAPVTRPTTPGQPVPPHTPQQQPMLPLWPYPSQQPPTPGEASAAPVSPPRLAPSGFLPSFDPWLGALGDTPPQQAPQTLPTGHQLYAAPPQCYGTSQVQHMDQHPQSTNQPAMFQQHFQHSLPPATYHGFPGTTYPQNYHQPHPQHNPHAFMHNQPPVQMGFPTAHAANPYDVRGAAQGVLQGQVQPPYGPPNLSHRSCP